MLEGPRETMKRRLIICVCAVMMLSVLGWSQGLQPEPVFAVDLEADRAPLVAGDGLRLAVVVSIESGWHINSDQPGDEFSMATTVRWIMPEGWPEPALRFPEGEQLKFEFQEEAIEVWEGEAVFLAALQVPAFCHLLVMDDGRHSRSRA